MLLYNDIVKDGDKVLRTKCSDVEFPISDEDFNTLVLMDEYLNNGYDEKTCKKYDLRPGVGLAAPQVGVNKKMLCIMAYDEKGDFHHYVLVNPKIISTSLELTYLESGEGCLSVDRDTEGITPRFRKITANAYVLNLQKNVFEYRKLELSDYIAIVFQHEYDHLFGTLYVDKLLTVEEAKKRGMKPLWED